MEAKNSLLAELEERLAKLEEVAGKMCALARGSVDKDEITHLQKEEEALIEKVVQLDEQVTKQYPDGSVGSSFPKQWAEIQKRLAGFQQLNEQFISDLSVRKALIGLEVQDVQKQRRDLSKLKQVYVQPQEGKTRRINTIT